MIQSRRRSNLLITLVAFVALAVASSSPVDAANSKHLRSKHHHNRQVKNEATTAKANNDDDNKARKPIEHRRKAMEAKSKSFRDDVLAPKKNAQPEKKKNVAVQASNRHDKVATSRSKIPRRTKDVVKKNANVQKKTNAKKIIQVVKASKIKVTPSIQGEEVRITGKKRDDLQQTIAMLKAEELDVALAFTNFRD